MTSVRSFDVFDTLIARRCVDPKVVFAIVGGRASLPTFYQDRVAAELDVGHGEYTIETIYAELSRRLGLEPTAVDSLKQLELQVEREQVIPIAENMVCVRDGDVLVSDMYLPAGFIRELLQIAGLTHKVDLMVSSHGKGHGTAWPPLLSKFDIKSHVGDNPESDVRSPRRYGISGCLTELHQPTSVESALMDAGLVGTARFCREVRLATWSDDPVARRLQLIQAEANLPMLILASLWLIDLVTASNLRHVLMSSRDCQMWRTVFARVCNLLSVDVETTYFLTSRLARVTGSADYRRYASELLAKDSIWVDLCGTGFSMSVLSAELGLKDQHLALIHQFPRIPEYENIAQTTPYGNITSLLGPTVRDVNGGLFEMSNYADHPMIADVQYDGREAVPVYAAEGRSAIQLGLVAHQQEVVRVGVSRLTSEVVDELSSLGNDTRQKLFRALYRVLTMSGADLGSAFGASHSSEDAALADTLGIVIVSDPDGSQLRRCLRGLARMALFRGGPPARLRYRLAKRHEVRGVMRSIRESCPKM